MEDNLKLYHWQPSPSFRAGAVLSAFLTSQKVTFPAQSLLRAKEHTLFHLTDPVCLLYSQHLSVKYGACGKCSEVAVSALLNSLV